MSTTMKYFNNSETLEMCDVHISENGKIEVATKSYHSDALERLGKPEKIIRGRVKMEKQNFVFEPYAEQSRKPTYSKQVHVGSCTTLAVTADKFKISMVMGRHMGQARTIDFIRAEMDDILAQLEGELYDMLVKASNENDNVNADAGGASVATAEALASLRSATSSPSCHPDGKVNVNVNVNVEKKGGKA